MGIYAASPTKACVLSLFAASLVATSPAAANVLQIGASASAGGPTSLLATGSNTGVTWNGSYAGLSFAVLAAIDPTPAGPTARFGSTLLTGSTGGTAGAAYFYVTELGLTSSRSTVAVDSHLTSNSLPTGWSIVETTYLDSANTPFGTGTLLSSATSSGVFAQDYANGSVPIISPFSLTEVYQINYSALNGSALSTEKITALTAVPEVSTWAMLMLGFGGLAFAGYRTKERNLVGLA